MNRRVALTFLLLLATTLAAQKKQVTLEATYDPVNRVNFSGSVQSGFDWLDDTTFVWPAKDAKGEFAEWRRFDVKTGKSQPLFDRAKIAAALEAAGIESKAATKASQAGSLNFDTTKSAIVLELADDLYVYSFTTGKATRLTKAEGEEEEATFSPDGQRVAFVRDNDLYVVDLAGNERRLTTGGSKTTLNGKLDWVYQEEIYGRGHWSAFWWSPDSAHLAFLQLDESPVPMYTIVDHLPYRPELEVYPYPKPGDGNPKVALKIVGANGGDIVTVDNARYAEVQPLIVNVDWTPDAKTVMYQVQNREQTWLELAAASLEGSSRTVIRETTKAWVDPIANPVWLKDGSFLWQSERSGYRHVYQYKPDGTLVRQITNGEWEVRDLQGTDGTFIYFTGTERSPIGQDTYRIRMNGTGLQRLSEAAGVHSTLFNPARTYYVDRWSDVRTPDQVRVYRSDGKLAHVVEANPAPILAEYELPTTEFMQVKTRDGFVMEAMMIKPSNFDPSKKYPVYHFVYSGPHAQSVRNSWGGVRFNQLVAQQGVIVWVCDNRTASGKGAVSAWPAWKNFGELELRDLEDSITWLRQQPYIDGSRIMMSGWSFGGYMTAYVLTHSTMWSAGIAGAPVTDWRDYDSIYTERYMLLPQNNEEGYKKSAPRFAAKDLHGHLLLLHGTIDDNVHLQNTIQFAQELQQAGKSFEMMLYPRARHSVANKKSQFHLQGVMLDFVRRELLDK